MERINGNFDPVPTRYVPPFKTIDLGKVDVKIDGHINVPNEHQGNIESRDLDHPHENGNQTPLAKLLTQNQDSEYVKCIVIDRPDDMLLKTPISKICLYLDDQFAIFDNTDHFTTVNRHTFAIVNARQLRGSHESSNRLHVLDAGCDWTTSEDRHIYYAYYDAGARKTMVTSIDGRLEVDKAKSYYMTWNDAKLMFEKQTSVVKQMMQLWVCGSVTILTDEGLTYYDIKDIEAFRWWGTVKPRSSITLVDASHCIQAYDMYVGDGVVFVVLTAKGMIQYVKRSWKDLTFSIAFTAQMRWSKA